MSENGRAGRLRDRRNRAKQRAQPKAGGEAHPDDGDSTENSPSSTDGAEEAASEPSRTVKEEQIGTYMYLPESQHKALKYQYNVLKAAYELEFEREFEKNRHYFPLVIKYGTERLDGAGADEIDSLLQSL
ncbi:hypothetical protein ACNS7O_17185 (plasmid) [Haloferacaceae archaeon DSL9]